MSTNAKPDAQIVVRTNGGGRRELGTTVRAVVLAADKRSLSLSISAVEGVELELRSALESRGFTVAPSNMDEAVRRLDTMRRSLRFEELEVVVNGPALTSSPTRAAAQSAGAPQDGVLEPERRYPDAGALALFDRLAGIDEQKRMLLAEIGTAVDPESATKWSKRRHRRDSSALLTAYRQRVPLIVLHGDVGTGKTAVAESVGAALVRDRTCKDVRLIKLTGQVRGKGLVGQMSDQLVAAFSYAETRAASLGPDIPLLLLIDEADAIATSRAGDQMHHEDRAGVDTLLQRLDRLKAMSPRPIVIFITNRIGAIDPALARRAALSLRFERPNAASRAAILHSMLDEYGISSIEIDQLVDESERSNPPFTASDLVDKIVVRALQRAVRNDAPLTRALVSAAILEAEPTAMSFE